MTRANDYVYTILNDGLIGGIEFSKIYVLPNDFGGVREVKKELPKLFNNCTAFVATDSIWIVKRILCLRELEQIADETGQFGIIVQNDQAMQGNTVCRFCRDMIKFYVNECKEDKFRSANQQKNTMFLKEEFKKYKRIDDKKIMKKMLKICNITNKLSKGIPLDRQINHQIEYMHDVMYRLHRNADIRIFQKENEAIRQFFDLGR